MDLASLFVRAAVAHRAREYFAAIGHRAQELEKLQSQKDAAVEDATKLRKQLAKKDYLVQAALRRPTSYSAYSGADEPSIILLGYWTSRLDPRVRDVPRLVPAGRRLPVYPVRDGRIMQTRLDAKKASPGAYQAMLALENFVRRSATIEPSLIELVKMRASQINGCAYCIDMHSKDARAQGESEQRLYALSAWRETPFFTARERAALAWTEAVTLITKGHVPDAVYEQARQQFSDEDLVNLTMALVAINGWNRLAIAFRAMPGEYQPAARQQEGGKR